jgi:hypothetical protein
MAEKIRDEQTDVDVDSSPASGQRVFANTILVIILAVLIGVAIYYLVSPDKNPPVIEDSTSQTTTSISPSITESTSSPTASPITGSTYETDVIKVTIPDGWTSEEATISASNDGSSSKQVPNSAAVNITKGNYILYINAEGQPSGGPDTGRLSDIMPGAPSADAVIPTQPNECGTSETHDGFTTDHPRVDLYIASTDKADDCNPPKTGTVWYFSYMGPGAFSLYSDDTTHALAITMAYNSKDVNKLPSKDDPTLATTLTEMTSIAKTLQVKTHTLAPVSSQ